MGLLTDKVIVITGAASGIGKATAIEIAREGGIPVVGDFQPEKAEQVIEDIKREGGTGLAVKTDVTKEDEVQRLIDTAVSRFGQIHGAFNNAGNVLNSTPLHDVAAKDYLKLMETNLNGVFWCMQHEIRALRASGGGSIVNCASIGGVVGLPMHGVYSATKHAVNGLTKSAAAELAQESIRVNSVLPGPVKSEIWKNIEQGDELLDAFVAGTPLGRYAEPIEIARPVVFLLSDSASYITGSQLLVDGGFTAV